MKNSGKILRTFLSLSVFLITVISSTAHCHEPEESKQECQQEEKRYVSPEQVEITDGAKLFGLLMEKALF
jgi:hypothetical protein